VNEEVQQSNGDKGGKTGMRLASGAASVNVDQLGSVPASIEIVDELDDDETDEIDDIETPQEQGTVVKIKLVITEVAQNVLVKGVRRLVSPIMSKFDLSPELGLFRRSTLGYY
jgi:hypothetical protein